MASLFAKLAVYSWAIKSGNLRRKSSSAPSPMKRSSCFDKNNSIIGHIEYQLISPPTDFACTDHGLLSKTSCFKRNWALHCNFNPYNYIGFFVGIQLLTVAHLLLCAISQPLLYPVSQCKGTTIESLVSILLFDCWIIFSTGNNNDVEVVGVSGTTALPGVIINKVHRPEIPSWQSSCGQKLTLMKT